MNDVCASPAGANPCPPGLHGRRQLGPHGCKAHGPLRCKTEWTPWLQSAWTPSVQRTWILTPLSHMLAVEIAFLRHQLGVARRRFKRAILAPKDWAVLVFLSKLFPWRVRDALLLVGVDAFLRKHKKAVKALWRLRVSSRPASSPRERP